MKQHIVWIKENEKKDSIDILLRVPKKKMRRLSVLIDEENTPPSKKPKKVKIKKKDIEKQFNAFWDLYPRKTGKLASKRIWFEKYKLMPKHSKLMKALKNQIADNDWETQARDKKERKWIPHPRTWISHGRWDDEVENSTKQKKKGVNVGYQSKRR